MEGINRGRLEKKTSDTYRHRLGIIGRQNVKILSDSPRPAHFFIQPSALHFYALFPSSRALLTTSFFKVLV